MHGRSTATGHGHGWRVAGDGRLAMRQGWRGREGRSSLRDARESARFVMFGRVGYSILVLEQALDVGGHGRGDRKRRLMTLRIGGSVQVIRSLYVVSSMNVAGVHGRVMGVIIPDRWLGKGLVWMRTDEREHPGIASPSTVAIVVRRRGGIVSQRGCSRIGTRA